MSDIPQNLVWYDAVQMILLFLLLAGEGWLAKRSIEQGERIVRLETNHEIHAKRKFERLYAALGLNEDDDGE